MALNEAILALKQDEVPVGAVIVKNDIVIGKGHNKKEKNNSIIAHAEIMAIKEASKNLKNWRLDDCVLFVTLEPCPMCASAIQQSRINTIYYGCSRNDEKNLQIIKQIFSTNNHNKKVKNIINCDYDGCKNIIKNYFINKRKKS